MNAADTSWIIVATALVLFMTLPGLALFYAGLVRARNVLSVLMQCFSIACLMSLLWLVLGYSIAFGDGNLFWGGLGKMFLIGVDTESLSGTLPEVLFFAFQMTFAIITPALIVGAYVERVSFSFVLLFSSLWMLFVYAPVVHWIWGGGLLSGADGALFANGVNDFAGGIVVHQTAGLAALVVAFVLGHRNNKSKPPHNPGMVMVGAAMLWVGWFGFNGGSALAADGVASMALTVTHISAAAATLSWSAWEKLRYGKASLIGAVTGTIAGLASITPASGSVLPVEALIIGGVAGILCQEACKLVKNVMNIDDTLDVFAVHGVGGMFGISMLVVYGYAGATEQFGGLLVVGVFTLVATAIIVYVSKAIVPMRVSEEEEQTGLDLSSHGESGYDFSS